MPRERDPNRDKAKKMYLDSNGGLGPTEIANELGISAGTVRGWKNKDGWEDAMNGYVEPPAPERPKPKKSAPKRSERSEKRTERSEPIRNVPIREQPPPKVYDDVDRDDPDERGLTPRMQIFVLEYMRDFNGTRAAMAAGYSKRSAYSTSWDLLRKPEIQAEIAYLKNNFMVNLGLDIQRVIAELMKIAFADVTDYVAFGQREVPAMGMFGPIEDEDGNPVMKTINYVDFSESAKVDGSVIREVKIGKDGASIKFQDKMAALKMLDRYLDFMTEADLTKLEKAKLEIKVMRGEKEEMADDGFLSALRNSISEVWADYGSDKED